MTKYSPIFEAIIENDKARDELNSQRIITFSTAAHLIKERRSLTRDAARVLSRDNYKGNDA